MQRIGSLAVLLAGMAFLLIPPIEVSATGVTDSLAITTDNGSNTRPQIVAVDSDTYAIVYENDGGTDGKITTVDITSTGDIGSAVIETVSFDTSSINRPQILAVDSDTFAITYTDGGGDKLITIDITATGDIGTPSGENTLSSGLASHTQIVKVDSDTFAFVLKSESGTEGQVHTRDISSTGTISTSNGGTNDDFTFDPAIAGDPQIIELSANHFAIVFEDDSSDEGGIVTVAIADDGEITQSRIENYRKFDDGLSAPQITQIDSDTYGLIFQSATSPFSPILKTTDISTTGDITNLGGDVTIFDAFTIDSGAGSDPQMTAVDDDTFAIVYCNASGDVAFRTLDIKSDGQIAAAVTETLDITNGNNVFPQILKISSTVFAVVYDDSSGNIQLKTITIPSETTAEPPKSSGGDTTAPTLGKSSTGRQVVENGFSYQSNLGGTFQTDVDLGLTHMDSLKVAVGGLPPDIPPDPNAPVDPNAPPPAPPVPPGDLPDDVREKLNERGLGDVAKTFDNISDAIDNLDNFFNRPPPRDVIPDETPPTPQEISGVLDNLKQGLDQSRVNPESHQNPEQAAQINNLLDRIAQKIAEIEGAI